RRHARDRLSHGVDAVAEQLRKKRGDVQGPRAGWRGFSRGSDGDRRRPPGGAAVSGTDEKSAEQSGNRRRRQHRVWRISGQVPRGKSENGESHPSQGASGGGGPRGGSQSEGSAAEPQGRPRQRFARQAPRLPEQEHGGV